VNDVVGEVRLTATFVAAAMRAAIVAGDAERTSDGVSIDTRTLKAGELYVAIRGDRFDGADFAHAAIEGGAAGVVVPRGWHAGRERDRMRRAGDIVRAGDVVRGASLSADRSVVFEVDDTTTALQALALAIRRESGTRVVAITGSAGKTTTKDVTSELLSARHRVIRNRGNLNNHIGLPLSLIALRHRPEIAVVELGMNHAGEIRSLVRVAEPDVRVWTNVGEAHLGFFASVDAIADAKAEIFEGAGPSTLLVANADDERISGRTPRFAGRVSTFGIDRPADVRATAVVDRGVDGTRARVTTPRGTVDLEIPLIGRGNLSNVLAATAVALEFDLPLDVIAERTARLAPSAHRGEVIRLSSGVTLIDDSYNANPTATLRALDVLAQAPGRRIAVLGEMLELGDQANALHERVGRAVAARRITMLFTVGGAPAARMARAAVDAGLSSSSVRHFATSDEAALAAVALVTRGDVVLVKGSRGVRTDRVVDRLKAERG
jgi:UDP-N-acetylmuramoyl-tripeptide--D-alanyl-D-alanine ligase